MARTFNCGIGMAVISSPDQADKATAILTKRRRKSFPHRRGRTTTFRRSGHSRQHLQSLAMLKIAVLISGRGSNLKSLIDACATPGFPAQITCVIANKADARGLDFARAAKFLPLSFHIANTQPARASNKRSTAASTNIRCNWSASPDSCAF